MKDMRGNDNTQTEMFSYIPLEKRVPKNHPLRRMKEIIDEVIEKMSKDLEEMPLGGAWVTIKNNFN